MDDSPYDPAHFLAPTSYHWTPRLQRDFLEAFATNGSVKISAAKVGMSPSAVYQLKQRPEGAAFRIGCAAAVLIARTRLADELLDRAIWGHDETTELQREDGRSFVKRRRIDSRLGLAMLARLDRMVETRARAGEEMLAQIVAGDWPGFLMLFDAADPSERYRIFERFYTLPEPLIERFYAAKSSPLDKLRILSGKPPVPIRSAVAALLGKGAPLVQGDKS